MDDQSVAGWIDQLANGHNQAADELWQHISTRLHEFALQKLDLKTRRNYDERDAANSALHSLCRGLAECEAESLAYLFDAKSDFLISSADKIVYRVLGNMHRGDQGISLEEILNKIGLTACQLPPQYRLEFLVRWTKVGFDERLKGLGFKSDSVAD